MKGWSGFTRLFTPNNTSYTEGEIKTLIEGLGLSLAPAIIQKLKAEILTGEIGFEKERASGQFRGTLVKRIQSYLWKVHKLQFEGSDSPITKALSLLNASKLSEDVYADLTPKMYWRNGDFGDNSSCYWKGNASTRYFLSNWEPFSAIRYYRIFNGSENNFLEKKKLHPHKYAMHDGLLLEGWGRSLLAMNFPQEGYWGFWNTYPNKEIVPQLVEQLVGKLQEINGIDLDIKPIIICSNGRTDGWFYTSGRHQFLIYNKRLSPIDKIDIKQSAPNIKEFPEYLGECDCEVPIFFDELHRKYKDCRFCATCSPKVKDVLCECCLELTGFLPGSKVGAKQLITKEGISFVCNTCFMNDSPQLPKTTVEERRKVLALA